MNAWIALLAVASPLQTPGPESITQNAFRDASFGIRVVSANQRELAKINKDFGTSYRFSSSRAFIKEPFKLRMEATVEDTTITFILNGTTQLIRVPRTGLNQRSNLANSPGRIQTLLDFGIITPSLLDGFFDAKFVRNDRATGNLVFDLTYAKPRFEDTSRHRVWVDPEKRYVTRREWYNQFGRQLATFTYENPIGENGAWIPTRVSVRNVDNKLAGVTSLVNVKLNDGLAETLFAVR